MPDVDERDAVGLLEPAAAIAGNQDGTHVRRSLPAFGTLWGQTGAQSGSVEIAVRNAARRYYCEESRLF